MLYSPAYKIFLISLILFCQCTVNKKSAVQFYRFTNDSVQQKANKEPEIIKEDYYKVNYLRYDDYAYKPNIRTVRLLKDDSEFSAPVIELNSKEKLNFSFDDLDGDIKDYKFTYIHCDANWQASDIMESEYKQGFMEDYIKDYKFSRNTLQKYTHYKIQIPNENINIIESGNYILFVYIGSDKENPVITRRFMVEEPKVVIQTSIQSPANVDDRNYKQEIKFTINKNDYLISNPYSDLKVVISQNGRWDNAIKDIKPMMVKDDILDYNYDGMVVFNGGNEFRHVDIKSRKYNSDRIKKIGWDTLNNRYCFYIMDDERRTFRVYMLDKDINGKFVIKNDDNALDNDVETDYFTVKFSLPYNAPMVNGDFYVFGFMTDWQYRKEAKMKYNYQNQKYETTMLLKQGYYNYIYTYLENKETVGDETIIEANHFETENDYYIYVYHREPGKTYDKLVGIHQINSLKK